MTHKIEIIGLGAGDLDQLPFGVYQKLIQTKGVVLTRTMDHPVIKALALEGVQFESFDHVYKAHDHFEQVYEEIAGNIKELALANSVIYTVPGHPMVAEKTVQLLLEDNEALVEVVGGQSFLDDLFTSLGIDPIDGFQFVDATSFKREDLSYKQHIIFSQVYDAFIASEVKLSLLEDLPPEYEITVVEAAGTKAEKKQIIPLEDLDRMANISNLTSIYIPPAPDNLLHHTFNQLRSVIKTLRGPDGCPWDKKQTHKTLRKYALEEVYELITAINEEDDEGIVEELGDVLLQVLLHSQIGEDEGFFTVDDVIKGITDKMIHRHPHVFSPESPKKSWDELKQEEHGTKEAESLLDSVQFQQPGLELAQELQHKAAKVGFDWQDIDDVWAKFEEEKVEFLEAVSEKSEEEMEKEFGDVLFVLANLARHYQIHSGLALGRTNRKFYQRFLEMERLAKDKQLTLKDASFNEMDELWEEAKRKER